MGGASFGPPMNQAPTGEPTALQAQGTVAQWNERGFGFVQFDEGTFAYVHNSQSGGEHLTQGEVIFADIYPSPRNAGKFEAQNVTRGFGNIGMFGEPPAKAAKTEGWGM